MPTAVLLPGIQALWGPDHELPFTYVRGQNIEMCRSDDREGEASLESVLLAGEYIIPKTRAHRHEHGNDVHNSEQQVVNLGGAANNDGSQGKKHVESFGTYRTLIVGGTHEHALTMEELCSPPDMIRASSLLMPKINDMYPSLRSEGWEPFKCIAGTVADHLPSISAAFIYSSIIIAILLYHSYYPKV